MELKGSLPHSYLPATCPYPEPDRPSLYPHIQLLEDFYIHGSVHRESDLINVEQYVTVCSLLYFCSQCSPDDGCQHPKHVELHTEI